LLTGQNAYVSLPVTVTGAMSSVTQDSTDANKIWCEAYADTDGTKVALGIILQTKPDTDVSPSQLKRAGLGDRRRDLRIMHEGIHDIVNVSISSTRYGQKVAPHPSGVQAWVTGLACLGWCLQPGVGTGVSCKVRIMSYDPEKNYF